MENNLERRFQQMILIVGCLLALAGIIVMGAASFNDSIWSDEAFSLRLTQQSFPQMISLTARDVHPPLYYISLRLFCGLLSFVMPALSVIAAAKLHSVLYMMLLAGLLATKLRKIHGPLTAGLALSMLFLTADFLSYGVEIRMYSMAAFFVTGAALSACTLLRENIRTVAPESTGTSPDHNKPPRSYPVLILWTLAASYTNYYACIAVFFLWLCVLIGVRQKKIPSFFKAAALTVLLYLPWLIIALRQFGEVSGNESYWIEPLSRLTILSWLLFVFNNVPLMIVSIVIILIAPVTAVLYRRREAPATSDAPSAQQARSDRNFRMRTQEVFLFCTPVLGVFLTGFFVSLLFRPVFVARYLLPAVPAMWCGMAVAFCCICRYLKKKSATAAMLLCGTGLAVCALICIGNMRDFHDTESYLAQETETLRSFYESLSEEDVIVTSNSHLNVNFAFLTDCECNIFNYEESPIFIEVFPSIRNMHDAAEADAWLAEGRHVYFLETDSDAFLRAGDVFSSTAYMSEERGRYFMEGPLTVYEVFLRR